LMLLTLAIRLADHIKRRHEIEQSPKASIRDRQLSTHHT